MIKVLSYSYVYIVLLFFQKLHSMATGISIELLEKLLSSKLTEGGGTEPRNEAKYLETLDLEGVANYMKLCIGKVELKNYREREMSSSGELSDGDQLPDPPIEAATPLNSSLASEEGSTSLEPESFIIVMTGAGLSTAAGIPDFRSEDSGLYSRIKKDSSFDLPSPESIFHIDYFKQNPLPFVKLAQELFPGRFNPTKSHFFLRLLQEKGLLIRLYTQNIDGLERRAGILDEKLVEAHGSFHGARCVECSSDADMQVVKETILKGSVPTCSECNCLVKPNIVFFGEALPPRFQQKSNEDFPKCKLLIILGTSLKVHPFAGLVELVSDSCPRLLLNKEPVTGGDMLKSMLGLPTGLDFSKERGYRDVIVKDSCDVSCERLAELLGWKDELNALYAKELASLIEEQNSDPLLQQTSSGTQVSNDVKEKP